MSERRLTEERLLAIKRNIYPIFGKNKFAVEHAQSLIHDLEMADAELEEYKKGYWGNPCKKHQKIEAWVASVKVDDESLHCFGCFLEARNVPLETEVERLWERLEYVADKLVEAKNYGCSSDEPGVVVCARCVGCLAIHLTMGAQAALEEGKNNG